MTPRTVERKLKKGFYMLKFSHWEDKDSALDVNLSSNILIAIGWVIVLVAEIVQLILIPAHIAEILGCIIGAIILHAVACGMLLYGFSDESDVYGDINIILFGFGLMIIGLAVACFIGAFTLYIGNPNYILVEQQGIPLVYLIALGLGFVLVGSITLFIKNGGARCATALLGIITVLFASAIITAPYTPNGETYDPEYTAAVVEGVKHYPDVLDRVDAQPTHGDRSLQRRIARELRQAYKESAQKDGKQ